MRKILSSVAVFTICALFLLFSGCASDIDVYDKVISEIRDGVYESTVEGYKVTAVCGEREKNYKTDGIANGREDFFILSIEGNFSSAPECSFSLNGKSYGGTMKKHPFNESYSFEVNAKTNVKEVEVSIKCANDTLETCVKSVKTENTKTASDVLNRAIAQLKKTIDVHSKNGVFDGEVYLRIIPNPIQDDGKYFWYVAFCKNEHECYSVLIDSESGEVVASKGE